MRVLLVKMSSLGDVVHTLPGVSDAVAALGADVTFDWVVEEAFAPVAGRHPAVAEVLPIAWRRWRRELRRNRGEMLAFVSKLRSRRYDLVLDAQGLIKSAAVTALARGAVKAGLSRASAREGAAAVCYRRRVEVPRNLHAVDRIRRLFAGALEYPLPAAAPDFGIAGGGDNRGPESGAARRCVLLHGTTWPSKHWPERFWGELAGLVSAAGFEAVLPWGNEPERQRAARIASGGAASVLPRLSLGELTDELSGAALVIGVDSGLAHLAAALAVPTLVLFGSTNSILTGCRGARAHNLQASFACSPCMSRECVYRGPDQTWREEVVVPACYASLDPERVWQAARELVHADRVLHF